MYSITKKSMKTFGLLLLIFLMHLSLMAKPRVIILTDILNEPDDTQSMVRFLVCANEFDVEGLIATTGCWLKDTPHPEKIDTLVLAYEKVYPNLKLHDPDYPKPEFLKSLIKMGNTGYSMGAVGTGKESEGSNHIISVLEKTDDRPVWVCVWGGANTLAQALWTIQETKPEAEISKLISKVRVYDLAGQDDAGAWMCKTFPDLFFIRSVRQWRGISRRVDGRGIGEERGGDESVFEHAWIDAHVQMDHGPLGAEYPDAAYRHEGDTPTFLSLIPNGLSDPEHPEWGGWGGRFDAEKKKNVRAINKRVKLEHEYDDYFMITDAADTWTYQGNVYKNNIYVPMFRWRVDFQHDFAARMDWCVRSVNEANHNPIAVVNGNQTKDVLFMDVKAGKSAKLDASKSSDPDGDKLTYTWWIYPEAGTYSGPVLLKDATQSKVKIKIPKDASGKTIHLILSLSDNGDPKLTSYRRIVMDVK